MEIKKANKDDLFLRTQLGKGKIGDEEFSLTIASNGSHLLVEFENEKYLIGLQSIVKDVIEFREKENGQT